MSLSLCMIVKDEAHHLDTCLESVATIVDELIVVDTGSTDTTVEIAQARGATVHTFTWVNDFAAARNAALALASRDWILVLDADEVLVPEFRPIIQTLSREGHYQGQALDQVLAISFLRHELGAQQSPYSLVTRLFRRHPEIRFDRPYHETIDDSVLAIQQREPQWQTQVWPQVVLQHTGYQQAAIAAKDKFNRARTLMASYLADHPQDAYICNKLGALYVQSGEGAKALAVLKQGLAVVGADLLTRYELNYHLGLTYRELHDFEAAQIHYAEAIAQPIEAKLKLGAYINLGSLLKHQGQLDAAIETFEAAIAVDPTFAMAYYNLGVAHRAGGYLEPAIAAYELALQHQPDYAEVHQNLGVALFKLGKLPECQVAFAEAIRLYELSNPAAAQKLRQGIKNLGMG